MGTCGHIKNYCIESDQHESLQYISLMRINRIDLECLRSARLRNFDVEKIQFSDFDLNHETRPSILIESPLDATGYSTPAVIFLSSTFQTETKLMNFDEKCSAAIEA